MCLQLPCKYGGRMTSTTFKTKQDLCQDNYIIFQGLISMWTFDLCLVENSNAFHNLKCLKGECESCWVVMLITCFDNG
jgi:hypothetical protein